MIIDRPSDTRGQEAIQQLREQGIDVEEAEPFLENRQHA